MESANLVNTTNDLLKVKVVHNAQQWTHLEHKTLLPQMNYRITPRSERGLPKELKQWKATLMRGRMKINNKKGRTD